MKYDETWDVSQQAMLFSPNGLKFFLLTFYISWTTKLPIKKLYVYDCVSVLCVCVCVCICVCVCVCDAKSVIISMFKYLPINSKFSADIPQCNKLGFLVSKSIFYSFYRPSFCFSVTEPTFFNWDPYDVTINFYDVYWAVLRLFHIAML